jgi:hypothetical protein
VRRAKTEKESFRKEAFSGRKKDANRSWWRKRKWKKAEYED